MAESVSLPASLRLTLGSMKAIGCSAATTEPDLTIIIIIITMIIIMEPDLTEAEL